MKSKINEKKNQILKISLFSAVLLSFHFRFLKALNLSPTKTVNSNLIRKAWYSIKKRHKRIKRETGKIQIETWSNLEHFQSHCWRWLLVEPSLSLSSNVHKKFKYRYDLYTLRVTAHNISLQHTILLHRLLHASRPTMPSLALVLVW